ncbi:hypothetical protein ACGFNU_47670 [Spirillospora sp. NPDC048911]|uniref:hypothetical protein n=1 Tax=Spirillospora sp. NPDC048911 TaxID=3364527 RepID=UPI003718C3FF
MRPVCGPGVAIAFAGCQIMHLLGEHEAEVCLGEAAVTRLGAALDDSGQLIATPSPRLTAVLSREEWARIRVDCDNDFSLVLSLASVAIAARENAPTRLWRGAVPVHEVGALQFAVDPAVPGMSPVKLLTGCRVHSRTGGFTGARHESSARPKRHCSGRRAGPPVMRPAGRRPAVRGGEA